MAMSANQHLFQSEFQVQKMSQHQIMTLNYLAMSNKDLREEILKAVRENPALEIVYDPIEENYKTPSSITADDFQQTLEQTQDATETLQEHLLKQIEMEHLSQDERSICIALINNLDKNGCYGSMLDPVTLLDKTRPQQNIKMLSKCIDLIHHLDPVGTCCKTPEESLLVQAQINNDATPLTLFILNNHLDLIVSMVPEKILKAIKKYLEDWHAQSFAPKTPIDNYPVNIEEIQKSITYIRSLNPFPAADFAYDVAASRYNQPDIVLTIEKVPEYISETDFSTGKIKADENCYFQVKYASGIIPEIRINPSIKNLKSNTQFVTNGKALIQQLQFRKNTIAMQGCAIVALQKEFFLYGPGNLNPLTRKQIAQMCSIHESTVSRMANKKFPKYFQCQWGVFPASHFFSSSINNEKGTKISAEKIKFEIQEILSQNAGISISDSQITKLLNEKNIPVARRTVAKYRVSLNIQNSYNR